MSKYISSFTFISRAVDRHSPEEPFCCWYKLYNYDYITFVNSLKQIAFFACWQQSGAIDAVGQSTVRDSQRLCQQVKLKTIKYFICHSNASLPCCRCLHTASWQARIKRKIHKFVQRLSLTQPIAMWAWPICSILLTLATNAFFVYFPDKMHY